MGRAWHFVISKVVALRRPSKTPAGRRTGFMIVHRPAGSNAPPSFVPKSILAAYSGWYQKAPLTVEAVEEPARCGVLLK